VNYIVIVFVPADAVAGAEGVDDPRQGPEVAEGELKGARQVDRAVGSVRAACCSGVREYASVSGS
jgi:hypothetical protein